MQSELIIHGFGIFAFSFVLLRQVLHLTLFCSPSCPGLVILASSVTVLEELQVFTLRLDLKSTNAFFKNFIFILSAVSSFYRRLVFF